MTAPRSRSSLLALAAALLATAPLLGGCFSGIQATTTVQSTMNSGNGTAVAVGDLRVENATLVLGPTGSNTATLIGTIFNGGEFDDRLLGVTIKGSTASITSGAELVPAQGTVSYGYGGSNFINSYAFTDLPSAFVPVTMSFERAGDVAISVLSVAPEGIYAGIAPTPPTAP